MRRIADVDPGAVRPVAAVIAEGRLELITGSRMVDRNSQHWRGRAGIAIEDVIIVAAGHRDRIWIEIEARSITGFGVR